jgi:tRNA G18 (ribose-2'-O)-methylase SpoU
MKLTQKKEVFIVLPDIRSVYNVGSIFRTADCFGVTNIILVGYTPTPKDRFGRARKDFSKVALGAEDVVAWQYFPKISQAMKFLKDKKTFVIGVEQSEESTDYKKIKPKFPVAFIFGNEVEGVKSDLLKQCDIVAEIPMYGAKESLNVSVAVGVALSRVLNL